LHSPKIWRRYNAPAPDVQKPADKNFQLFRINPRHPSLRFERKAPELCPVRVSSGHRAQARQLDDNLIWLWIGTHDEYERILRDL
jgi:hypothetical protein